MSNILPFRSPDCIEVVHEIPHGNGETLTIMSDGYGLFLRTARAGEFPAQVFWLPEEVLSELGRFLGGYAAPVLTDIRPDGSFHVTGGMG